MHTVHTHIIKVYIMPLYLATYTLLESVPRILYKSHLRRWSDCNARETQGEPQ